MADSGDSNNLPKQGTEIVPADKKKKDKEHDAVKRKLDSWTKERTKWRDVLWFGFKDAQLFRHSYTDNVIGAHIFAKGLTEEMKKDILSSPAVQSAMDDFRVQNPTYSIASVKRKSMKIIDQLATDFKDTSTRLMAYSVSKILQQLYNGIHISQKDLTRVKEMAKKAEEEGIPLIMLPTHKSHIDYLVVSYVFFLCGLSLPFIAAGDNLNIPIVGQLLRNSGAFFIRRKFENDKLYRVIFNTYIEVILNKGYNLEFFIEGGRSRTGKLLRPRMGLISVIVDAVLAGNVKDAYLVPISIGYDKVIETPSYVKELLGANKERESLSLLLKSTRLLKLNFGRIDIRMAKPFSLKDYLNQEIEQRKLQPLRDKEHKKMLVQILSYSILHQINQIAVAMPTALVVAILLTHRGRGIGRKDLIRKFEWLRKEIIARGGKVATPDMANRENTGELIDTAVNVLGNLIAKQKNVIEPVFTPTHRFELAYYRNQIIHLFANEGMVACGLYSHLRRRETSVDKSVLLEDVTFLSQILKWELIYTPSPNIQTTFSQTLDFMIKQGTLSMDSSNSVVVCPQGQQRFDFLCALFLPFIDSLWLVACSFYSLWPDKMMEEKSFLNKMQMLGFTLYHQGELNYYESLSKETLQNGISLFLSMSIIERYIVDEKGLSVYKLNKEYHNGDERLLALIEKIGSYRREGKYSSNDVKLSPALKDLIKLITPGSKL